MQIENLETEIFSSFRGYQQAPEAQLQYFQHRLDKMKAYTPAVEQMLNEPLLVDDLYRGTPEDVITFFITQTESLVCLDEGKVAGLAVFLNVIVNREAEFMGWVNPDYRSGNFENQKKIRVFLSDVMEYAWNRLNLVRMETRVSKENKPALHFAENAGFQIIGNLRKNFQTQGRLLDSVLLEAVNPKFEIPEIEKITHVRSEKTQGQQRCTDGDDPGNIESGSTIHASGGSGTDSEGAADGSGGSLSRVSSERCAS